MSPSAEEKVVSHESMMQGFELDPTDGDVTLDARCFRYTSLPSHFDGLDDSTIARIEEAPMCCHLRDFESALQIFEALPSEFSWHPALVYEYSNVLWNYWSLHKCEKVLERGISWAKEHTKGSQQPGIYTLLRIA